MVKYITKRLLRSLLTLFIIITAVFSLLRLMPIEGYFQNYEKMSQTQINIGLEKLGLKDPLPMQLLKFYKNALQGDLGVSNKYRVGVLVTEIIAQKVLLSLGIGVSALAISLLAGLPLGIIMSRSAHTKYRIGAKLGTLIIVVVQAIPAAVYYVLIQFYVTDWTNLPMRFTASNPLSWILPVLSLSLGYLAYYAMWLQRYMADESSKPYVQLLLAKGVSPSVIFRKHVFRNAFVPLAQMIPTSIAFALVGSVYLESLYSIPGVGGLLVNVIQLQDNTVVQALVLLYATIGILGMLAGDVLMALADPRITLSGKEAR